MCQTPRSGRWRVLLWTKPVRTLALQGTAALQKTDGAFVNVDMAVQEELSVCVFFFFVCLSRIEGKFLFPGLGGKGKAGGGGGEGGGFASEGGIHARGLQKVRTAGERRERRATK